MTLTIYKGSSVKISKILDNSYSVKINKYGDVYLIHRESNMTGIELVCNRNTYTQVELR